jgi:hypothetical protein
MIQFFTTSKHTHTHTHTHTQNKKSSLTQKRINFEHFTKPLLKSLLSHTPKKEKFLTRNNRKIPPPRPKTKQNRNPKPEN